MKFLKTLLLPSIAFSICISSALPETAFAHPHPPVEDTETPIEDTETPIEDTELPEEEPETPVEDTELPEEEPETPVEDTELPEEEPELPEEEAAEVIPTENQKVEIVGGSYGGSGCPDGSASVNVSPDGQELTILFDKFEALGNSDESRKSCNLTIPIKVPQGLQVSLFDADYRGYVAPKTTGKLRSEYFFAGTRGPVFERLFEGETDYNVRDPLKTVANVWTACGDSVNMRVNASMNAKGKGVATVDSFDLAHRGLVYHVKYRTCQ